MGITHFDEAPRREYRLGHLLGNWTLLGEAAGSVGVGVRRIEVEPAGWSTPVHDHGRSEELFYVLAGRGLLWSDGETFEVRGGDCVLCRPGRAHTFHAPEERLDLLAFGPRGTDESPRFPRLGLSLVGRRAVESFPSVEDGYPIQFVREAALGPPDLPVAPSPRPASIVSLDAVEGEHLERLNVVRTRRNLGRAVGSVTTGLQHCRIEAGMDSTAQHCHSAEEEIFVVLVGDGVLVLDDDETPVRPGHVVARPPATGVAHVFRAGDHGLTYLAYGTREPNDICYYPRSNKISFRGVGVIARLERLEYWDGEG